MVLRLFIILEICSLLKLVRRCEPSTSDEVTATQNQINEFSHSVMLKIFSPMQNTDIL